MQAREIAPKERQETLTVGEVTHTSKQDIEQLLARLREQTDEAEREERAI